MCAEKSRGSLWLAFLCVVVVAVLVQHSGLFVSLFKNLSHIVLLNANVKVVKRNGCAHIHNDICTSSFCSTQERTSCHSMIHYYIESASNQHNYLHIISYGIGSLFQYVQRDGGFESVYIAVVALKLSCLVSETEMVACFTLPMWCGSIVRRRLVCVSMDK